MKTQLKTFALLGLVIGSIAGAGAAPAVPGHSVGKIQLGQTQKQVRAKLGKPQEWQKFSSTLASDIYLGPEIKDPNSLESRRFLRVVYQKGAVAQIEWNSPEFKTKNGISTRSSLGEFRAKHPKPRTRAYTYLDEGGGGYVGYYFDDVKGGIAFQLGTQDYFDARVLPESLIIHRRNVPVIIAPGGKPAPGKDEVPVGKFD